MSKTAIIYWSGTGNTETMAMAVADGAKQVNPDAALFSVSDITADAAAEYDILALGCPAMGAEVLDEGKLNGKKVALFGSYGWGDGEWMRSWEERIIASGATLVGGEGLIVNEAPDNDALEQCKKLGSDAANA